MLAHPLPAPVLNSHQSESKLTPRSASSPKKSRSISHQPQDYLPVIQTLNQAVQKYLRSKAKPTDYQRLIASLGKELAVNGVILVINDLLSQRYEWTSRGVTQILNHPRMVNFFASKQKFPLWKKTLASGRPVAIEYSNATRDQKLWLSSLGIKTLWVFPIMIQQRWWAYLLFYAHAAQPAGHLTELLAVSSGLVGGIRIERYLIELELRETVEFWKHEQQRVLEEVQNTKKFQQAVQGVNDGVVILAPDQKVIYANPAWCRMIRLTETEVEGQTLERFFQAKSALAYRQMWEELATKAAYLKDDVTLSVMNDGELPVRVSASSIHNGGQERFIVVLFEDITKRQELDRAKTEFISIASHQLNTPLSAIKWFIDLIDRGKYGEFTDHQKEVISQISQSTDRMIALVRSLLNISRIESGRILISPRLTDVRRLVNDVIQELNPELQRRSQQIVTEVAAGFPAQVMVDGQLLRHVYLNLLSNAGKYSPVGAKITITLELKGEEIVSCVRDQGMGIPETEQKKIFTKFFRAPNVLKTEAGGSGLGLYLVKIVAESSGGRVWFHSQEGHGSEFCFALPKSGMLPKQGQVMLDQKQNLDQDKESEK